MIKEWDFLMIFLELVTFAHYSSVELTAVSGAEGSGEPLAAQIQKNGVTVFYVSLPRICICSISVGSGTKIPNFKPF